MLKVNKIKLNNILNGYYLKQDGGYYLEKANQKELYQWMGKGAEKLGLVGNIDPQVHIEVFSGLLPGGIEVGKRNEAGVFIGRPGYDFTFSMSKDISLIICCTQDKVLKDYFLKAHIDAVKTAMREVEKTVSTRRSVSGCVEFESTKNMVASLCTHLSSRAGDPQVHTHVLVANTTQCADGQWRALSTDMQRAYGFLEKSLDHATYFGHIYQNEFARAVRAKQLDIERANKHGMFKLTHFPENVRQFFSKRREQIKKIVDSLEHADKTDKKLFDRVAEHSRAAKVSISTKDFIQQSQLAMQDFLKEQRYSKKFDAILSDCVERKQPDLPNTTERAEAVVSDAIHALSSFSVKLDANHIIEKALHFDLGVSSLTMLQKAISDKVEEGVLLKTSSGHFTTKALIEGENQFLLSAQKTIDSPNLEAKTVRGALLGGRACIVKEPAKLSEKLRLIDHLIKDFESSGKKVQLLTQTNSMASQHNEHRRSQEESVWQRLKQLGKEDKAKSLHGFLYRYEQDISNPINNLLSKKGKDVFIVEDAQRMSMGAAQKLMDLTEKRQATLVFLSFYEGLSSPLAGNALSMMQRAGVPVVDVPLKTKDVSHQPLALTYAVHEIKPDLNATPPQKQRNRQVSIAKAVVAQHGQAMCQVEVFSVSQQSAKTLSGCIRDELKVHSHLGSQDHQIIAEHLVTLSTPKSKHAQFFKVGMVAKRYVGRGQFDEKIISRVDAKQNRLMAKGVFGREKYITPVELLSNSETKLYDRKTLHIADGERICIHRSNKLSQQLGLSVNTVYQVSLQDNKVVLLPDNDRLKTIQTKIKRLNGLDMGHAYVNTLNKNAKLKRVTTHAVLDAPSYTLNQSVMKEFNRTHQHLAIYTDNQSKAEKRLGVEIPVPSATDLSLVSEKSSLTPVEKALDYGLSLVSAREAAFSVQSVIEKSLSYGLAQVSFHEVRALLIKKIKAKELQVRAHAFGDIWLATKETLALERDIIVEIQQGKNAVIPFMSKALITQQLAHSSLTSGQKMACTLLASTCDRFVMVQGYAGTGKSTMLDTLKGILEEHTPLDSARIIALAPTHKAVKELREKGLSAQTLKSFLVNEQSLVQEEATHLDNKLILLDESSMVSNQDFKALQSIVARSNSCRCAYIGDIAQLSPVEAGKPSELAYIAKAADICVATMNEVLRQKTPQLKAIAQDIMQGTPKHLESVFYRFNQAQCIQEDSNAIEKLAIDYGKLSGHERSQTVVAVATNQNRQLLNAAIRTELQRNHVLSGGIVSNGTALSGSRT